jgi:hypothetical protein
MVAPLKVLLNLRHHLSVAIPLSVMVKFNHSWGLPTRPITQCNSLIATYDVRNNGRENRRMGTRGAAKASRLGLEAAISLANLMAAFIATLCGLIRATCTTAPNFGYRNSGLCTSIT